MDVMWMAVGKGHRILDIYEVYEYQVTQYSPESYEGRLIVGYMNKFSKLKAEASGYPGWVHRRGPLCGIIFGDRRDTAREGIDQV